MSKEIKYCIQRNLKKDNIKLKTIYKGGDRSFTAGYFKSKLWDVDSVIKIQFVEPSNNISWTPMSTLISVGNNHDIDPIEKDIRNMTPEAAIKKVVMEKIQPHVSVKFEFVNIKGDVRIGFTPSEGSYSFVGTDCKQEESKKTLNFGWLDARTIMHEFGHVLGMIHEHQNPLGEPIKWDESYIYDWAKKSQGWDQETTYNNIIKPYNVNDINGSYFDDKSIMLYFFPPEFTMDKKGTVQNNKLSDIDIEWMDKIYPTGILPKNNDKTEEEASKSKIKSIIMYVLIVFLIVIVAILIFKKIIDLIYK